MRGDDDHQGSLFSYVSLESRIPADHPLRPLRKMVNEVLEELCPEFERLYSKMGRPSVPPERLLRALLLQVLYSIRSERQLIEQLDYNLLYRWFVGLGIDDPVWVPTVFTKNRDRLLEGGVADRFFEKVLEVAEGEQLISREHFTVDSTMIEAWAGMKSFLPKDDDEDPPGAAGRNPDRDFRGKKRSNKTHESKTDPDCRLVRKGPGKPSQLAYQGHIVTENRSGLVVGALVTTAHGRAEWEAGVELVEQIPRRKRITVGADRGYDSRAFTEGLRAREATPHVAQHTTRHYPSTIDRRTTRHPGYRVSQKKRKRIEEVFGWMKTVGILRKTRHKGRELVNWMFTFTTAVYNLVRIRNLTLAPT